MKTLLLETPALTELKKKFEEQEQLIAVRVKTKKIIKALSLNDLIYINVNDWHNTILKPLKKDYEGFKTPIVPTSCLNDFGYFEFTINDVKKLEKIVSNYGISFEFEKINKIMQPNAFNDLPSYWANLIEQWCDYYGHEFHPDMGYIYFKTWDWQPTTVNPGHNDSRIEWELVPKHIRLYLEYDRKRKSLKLCNRRREVIYNLKTMLQEFVVLNRLSGFKKYFNEL